MSTNRTSWETMQRKQLALSCAKDAKANYAGELEKLRLTLDYLRSLHRNAHNWNNRQDYLVRLNVDTSKVICLR